VTPPREALLRAGLVVLSLAVCLFAGETAMRVSGYAPERSAPVMRIYDSAWTTLLDCYPTNPRGYFDIDLREAAVREQYQKLAPQRFDNVARRAPFAVLFRYNGLRFRDRPPEPKPAGVTRIVIVGDSFTEGQGVKEADTYARVLESRLNGLGPARFEVRNAGRRGADFPALYDAFTASLQYEPDLVIYGMVLNDADRSPDFQARQAYLNDWIVDRGRMETPDNVTPEPGPLSSRLFAFARDRWDAYRIGRASTRWYRDMYSDPNREGWLRTQGFVRSMDEQMRRRGGRFAVALWPLLVDLGPRYPFQETHAAIARFCEASGITFRDLRPALAVRPAAALWVHPLDRHPNEEAHRLAAESLVPLVEGARR
jgi:hypothetical protein